MDDRGRLSDRAVLRELGWVPGTPLNVRVQHDIAIITASRAEHAQVTAPGQFRLPAVARHRLGLRPGDRVLLVALLDAGRLTVYPPVALDALITRSQADLSGESS